TLGGFDGLVYAAGIQRDASVLRMETDDFRAVLDVALVAPFAFVRAAARVMVERKSGGSVVLFTAPNALFGSARQANTASAWAGVVGLTRTAAIELRRHGIRVNAIAPTARTRINEELPLFQGVRSESLRAEHIAPVVAYLLSPRAEHVSGEVLGVAGGRVYSLRARETSGTPPDARITAENLPDFWDAITRT
ncbi:MAG: SDR family oxidoreductase, partial [Myxococcales bacterium]|nr:SDR family oxidoreductase [Myxococcales bacterium]